MDLHYPDGSRQMPLPLEDLPDLPANSTEVFDETRALLQKKLDELKRVNQRKYQELLQMGATPAPNVIVMSRLEALVDVLLGPDSRIGFELSFEGRMNAVLTEAVTEVRQRKLLDGNGMSGLGNGLIVPG